MPNQIATQITVPVEVQGVIQNVTFDIADAEARQRISELGKALYWAGITTTVLTDGASTNPIVVNGESVTVTAGAVAQYNTVEFAFDGTVWQKLGEGNLGALAYKNSASGSYTPAGTVDITEGADTTDNVIGITAVGSLPSFSYDSTNQTLIFNSGTLPTADTQKSFVTASGTRTATFTGTQSTITVE